MIHKARKHADAVHAAWLEPGQAYVPGGMFLGWAIGAGLGNDEEFAATSGLVDRFLGREITGPQLFETLSGTLDDETLDETGYAFAEAYFGWGSDQYFTDYGRILGTGSASVWHVEDTWENFDLLRPRLDERFRAWSAPA